MKTTALMLAAAGLAVLTTGVASTDTAAVQLPPEILVDRQMVRAERLMAEDDPLGAVIAMDRARLLHEENGLEIADEFHFTYAQAAYAAGMTERAVEAVNEYLLAAGQDGEHYREALVLLDTAETRRVEEAAERRRHQREREREDRRRAAAEAARQELAEARRLGPRILWIGRPSGDEYTNAIRRECRPVRFTEQPSTANVLMIGDPRGLYSIEVVDTTEFLAWARRPDLAEDVCAAIANLSDRQATATLSEVNESSIYLLIDGRGLRREHIMEFPARCPDLDFTRIATRAEYFVIGGRGISVYDRTGGEVNWTNASLMTNRILDTCRALERLTR